MRSLKEQVKKHYVSKIVLTFHCLNKLFSWSQNFCSCLAFSLEFQNFSRSLEQFFLTVGQNNFGNKIPFPHLLNSFGDFLVIWIENCTYTYSPITWILYFLTVWSRRFYLKLPAHKMFSIPLSIFSLHYFEGMNIFIRKFYRKWQFYCNV